MSAFVVRSSEARARSRVSGRTELELLIATAVFLAVVLVALEFGWDGFGQRSWHRTRSTF